jgi:hypothetical protein
VHSFEPKRFFTKRGDWGIGAGLIANGDIKEALNR